MSKAIQQSNNPSVISKKSRLRNLTWAIS